MSWSSSRWPSLALTGQLGAEPGASCRARRSCSGSARTRVRWMPATPGRAGAAPGRGRPRWSRESGGAQETRPYPPSGGLEVAGARARPAVSPVPAWTMPASSSHRSTRACPRGPSPVHGCSRGRHVEAHRGHVGGDTRRGGERPVARHGYGAPANSRGSKITVSRLPKSASQPPSASSIGANLRHGADRPRDDAVAHRAQLEAPTGRCSRRRPPIAPSARASWVFCTLPIALRGSDSTKRTRARPLVRRERVATWSISSCSPTAVPGRSTTQATIRSPRSSSGTPATAASATAGCSSSAASISPAPILVAAALDQVGGRAGRRCAGSRRRATCRRSPVRNQPSR